MNEASEKMMYEAAAVYRDKNPCACEPVAEDRKVVTSPDTEYDVFGIWRDETYTAVGVFFI